MDISSVEGTIVEYQGVLWILGSPSVTSDGFVTAWGTPSDGEVEDGHSFFLGQAPTLDVALLASGARYWDPEDRSAGGLGWWIVQGPCSDREALYASGFPSPRSGGPGRPFAEGPRIRRNRAGTRVLVTQNFGWDI